MGAYNSVYVGVYISAPSYKEEVKRNVWRKPNNKISKTRFNPETGEEYMSDIITEMVNIEPHPYIEEDGIDLCEDEFFSPAFSEENVFILNGRSKYVLINGSDIFTISIDLDVNSLKNEFSKEYSKYLDYYRKIYPKSNIEVRFGVLHYAH